MGPRNFREYPVWQEAVDFASMVYEVTGNMPWFEKKGLCDQLQSAVVSISSNIAEGAARPSDADFLISWISHSVQPLRLKLNY